MPHTIFPARRDQAGAAASCRRFDAVLRVETRIVVEQHVANVVRTAARFENVHVNVLRISTPWITAGPYGVECIAAGRIGTRPPTQTSVLPYRAPLAVGRTRIVSICRCLIGVNDDAGGWLALRIEDLPGELQTFARFT